MIDFVLIGSLGAVLLYVWVWLPESGISPRFYPRIVTRAIGGVAVMAVVLALRVLHPGVTVDFSFGTQAVLVAIGTMAGLGIGVYEARTLIQAEILEARNEELKRTEERLEEAVGDLEDSNDRLEQFAYAASHDLQEPLRMVTSYLRLIENRYGDELDDDCTEFIEFAVDGADRMRAMIDGLLDYSRVETQGDPFETVDLDAVLDDVLTDLQFKIDETDTEISREPLPAVDGDRRQFQQLFQNLVSNAIDYSGDEPPRIHVSATPEGDDVTIAVRDEGVGIDADDTDRIFDIFQRLHSSEEQAGSGLGLALCKRIVERHDGEIDVESEPGVGSTFAVTLPLRTDPPAPAERRRSARPTET
ncbi:ATP-binding protein [Natrinema sp. S1CR25-10]|uniref:histidine kinase n=2 Tax=Natrinema salsiterrestre TaxID=2950540 RepID=A0A9Q4Q1I3_9EURY|nr:ATP-binding protein [Natrinema salsiterrestre]MDF9745516.1 ATP-binding protein [Natrinema salsiterrestre]